VLHSTRLSGILVTQSEGVLKDERVQSVLGAHEAAQSPITVLPWPEARPRILGAAFPDTTTFFLFMIDYSQHTSVVQGWVTNEVRGSRTPLIYKMPVIIWDWIKNYPIRPLDQYTKYASISDAQSLQRAMQSLHITS
jgi:hypothetical protein